MCVKSTLNLPGVETTSDAEKKKSKRDKLDRFLIKKSCQT